MCLWNGQSLVGLYHCISFLCRGKANVYPLGEDGVAVFVVLLLMIVVVRFAVVVVGGGSDLDRIISIHTIIHILLILVSIMTRHAFQNGHLLGIL